MGWWEWYNPVGVEIRFRAVTQGGASRLTPLRLPWAVGLRRFQRPNRACGQPWYWSVISMLPSFRGCMIFR